MLYEFSVGNYKPTDLGVKRLFGTFKKRGRSYQIILVKKRFPISLIDREVILICASEPPIVLPSKKVFEACFNEIIPNYATYGIGAIK